MTSPQTFRYLLVPVAILTLLDAVSTTLDMAAGIPEANPVAHAAGGPQIMLAIKAAVLLIFYYRSFKWDKPRNIKMANIILIIAIPWTLLAVLINSYGFLLAVGVL